MYKVELLQANLSVTQTFSLWLLWKLIDQWPLQPLVDKRG